MSNRRKTRIGGRDPRARQILSKATVRLPIVIGHCWSARDPSAKIYADPRQTIEMPPPDGKPPLVDLRCAECETRPVGFTRPTGTVIAVEHEPDCPWLSWQLEQAGVS